MRVEFSNVSQAKNQAETGFAIIYQPQTTDLKWNDEEKLISDILFHLMKSKWKDLGAQR